jgi:hypothetical protein
MKTKLKAYLGDGAYVETGSYFGEIVLTTSDGIRTTNAVVLGPDECSLLIEFIKNERAANLDPQRNRAERKS